MIERSQDQVMARWPNDWELPVVSICCATYNHENYIGEALDSFLAQETDFPFEIIVHDDASLDSTPQIVRGYAARFPDIVRPILQTENQRSQGVRICPMNVFPVANGRYIAMCEGDDFWIDSQKLQRQYEALDQNQNVDLCFHPAEWGPSNTIADCGDRQRVVGAGPIIAGFASYIPTASIFARLEAVRQIPMEVLLAASYGDYFVAVWGSMRGGALYLPRKMAHYREDAPGGWTVQQRDPGIRARTIRRTLEALAVTRKYIPPSHDTYVVEHMISLEVHGIISPLTDWPDKRHFMKLLVLDIVVPTHWSALVRYAKYKAKVVWRRIAARLGA